MYISYGRRVDGDDIEHARAVIAPGFLPTTDVDINQYHCTTAHTHPRLLRESVRQQGVVTVYRLPIRLPAKSALTWPAV